MSTLLASLAVVAVAICVLRIALRDPDQPATTRRSTNRARGGARRPEPAGDAAGAAAEVVPETEVSPPAEPASATVVPETEVSPVPAEPAAAEAGTGPASPAETASGPVLTPVPEPAPYEGRRRLRRSAPGGARVRVRSALTLVILVTFVGILLAVAVGAALTFAAEALRDAVG